LLTDEDVNQLKPIMEELIPKLNAYYRSIDKAIAGTKSKNKVQSSKLRGSQSS